MTYPRLERGGAWPLPCSIWLNMKAQIMFRLFFVLIALASLNGCVDYHQGDFNDPNGKEIPAIQFQSKVFFISPPIHAKIGESNDDDTIKARSLGQKDLTCAQFSNLTWKANVTSSPAQVQSLPKELRTEAEESGETNSKVKRQSKITKNEFSISPLDVSMYRNNPNPLELVESLNIFSADILPKKITGETQRGNTPDMLLRYMKYVNDNSEIKVTGVMSVAKVSGGFHGIQAQNIKNNKCNTQVIEGIEYGAAISVAIMIKFQSRKDRNDFESDFGIDSPFSLGDKPEHSDAEMSARLSADKAQIEMSIAEIGGDIDKTRAFVSKISCGVGKLSDCRKARRDIIRYFFDQELQKPTSPDQTNGWIPVSLDTVSYALKK